MNEGAHLFEAERGRLTALAYRMLGTYSDAEDIVQECYIKFQGAMPAPDRPAAWLTRICTNLCIDRLRHLKQARTEYYGVWIPELVEDEFVQSPEDDVALAQSLTLGFLMVLERLSAKERAAFLLRDIFDVPYPDVAKTLGVREDAARKTASRAREKLNRQQGHAIAPPRDQSAIIDAFERAVKTGDVAALQTLLAQDITLIADGGGVVPAIFDPIEGRGPVLRFLTKTVSKYWENAEWLTIRVNGQSAVAITLDDVIHTVVSFAYGPEGQVQNILIMRNPRKMQFLARRLKKGLTLMGQA